MECARVLRIVSLVCTTAVLVRREVYNIIKELGLLCAPRNVRARACQMDRQKRRSYSRGRGRCQRACPGIAAVAPDPGDLVFHAVEDLLLNLASN